MSDDDDIEYVMSAVREELSNMSQARRRSVMYSRDSFVGWLQGILEAIGYFLGQLLSIPEKLWEAFQEGFRRGYE